MDGRPILRALWGPVAGTQAPTFAHVGLKRAGGRSGQVGRFHGAPGRRTKRPAQSAQPGRSTGRGSTGGTGAPRRPAGRGNF